MGAASCGQGMGGGSPWEGGGLCSTTRSSPSLVQSEGVLCVPFRDEHSRGVGPVLSLTSVLRCHSCPESCPGSHRLVGLFESVTFVGRGGCGADPRC